MLIDIVDNRGMASMAGELKTNLNRFGVAKLATASLTRDGLAELEQPLLSGKQISQDQTPSWLVQRAYGGSSPSKALSFSEAVTGFP
jgi:hypothetical protein